MPQRRYVARAALTATAATACLALAAPAWASSTIPLNPAHKGSTAADAQQECEDERFTGRTPGQDGWHFVLPGGAESGSFETLTLTFSDGTNTVTVKVPDSTDAYPDHLYPAGNTGRMIHAYLFTPAGWTLVDGTATISGEADKFNLSHACAGTAPTQSPSPSPSTSESPQPSGSPSESTSPTSSVTPTESGSPSESTSPSTPVSGSPSQSTGSGGGNGGNLPKTGVATASIALGGLVLIGGGVLLMLRRRRDNITFTS
ncbi:LPXTG cell wall anchor domain-containing protein [Micromonospora purpureochromogenes]|uniref:LPXTG cell wall anchor domain-containing protein n=1 Tax=Micromonospora purpureochromogenes TaxID=47872 RepID=UPI003630F8C2